MMAVSRSDAWAAAVLLSFVVLCAPFGAMAAEPKRVLLLHSFGREIVPYATIVAAFRTELAHTSSEPIAIYEASLEAAQRTESDDRRPFLELLRHRYSGSMPDVVITIGPPAAAFYEENRDKLFPGRPAVIAVLDELLVPKSALRPGDSVIPFHTRDTAAIDNILRLLPDTQRIAVVLGDSPLERFWLQATRTEFAPYAGRVSFEWFNKLSFEEMLQRVANLPPHSAVLYGLLIADANGVPNEKKAALQKLLQASVAPIFSFYESEFGHGVVGGPFVSEEYCGAVIAAAVLRTLHGQHSADPVIEPIGYEAPVYDWRALKRWGISLDRLAPGSEIRFRPPSLWDEHRVLIVTAITLFAVQAALLIGLLWQRSYRRRAEQEAQALSGRLIDAHEDERRWLARELHDDLTQRVAVLAIDAALLPGADMSSSDTDADRSVYGRLVQLGEDIHSLSYRLHPSVLDDLGLVEALKAECDRVARSSALHVDIEADRLPQNLPREVALCIYRVAQEALRNISRHAKASMVRLSLALSDGGLCLAVSDNGSGFEPGAPTRRPSLGHASMRERIRLSKGRLDIQSVPGGGTTIRAWVPIPKATP
jgi:signal transduction histidine kinase